MHDHMILTQITQNCRNRLAKSSTKRLSQTTSPAVYIYERNAVAEFIEHTIVRKARRLMINGRRN